MISNSANWFTVRNKWMYFQLVLKSWNAQNMTKRNVKPHFDVATTIELFFVRYFLN